MNKTSRFFRRVWQINALLILVAAAGATFAVCALVWSEIGSNMRRQSTAAVAPVIPGKQASPELRLGGFSSIAGTSLYRATLSAPDRSDSKIGSSSYSSETRNVLVVDSATASAHWLLPTDKELIVYDQDVAPESKDAHVQPPLATVVLVKSLSSNPEAEEGRILVSDLAATDVREVASGVREVHGAAHTSAGQIVILFEQKRTFHLAMVDANTRHLTSDRVVNVPALK